MTATLATPDRVLVPLLEAPVPAGVVRGDGMPPALEARYGGPLLIPLRPDRPTVIANFVSTLDGIVAFGQGPLSGGGLISGQFEPDRFVMGLLRAVADVVVVGAGTLRGSTHQRWTPGHIHPASAATFAGWRQAMGLAPQPTTVFVSATGDLPTEHPAFHDLGVPAVVATTAAGARRVDTAALGDHVSVWPIRDEGPLTGDDIAGLAATLGGRLVLTEGGPTLLGGLVAAGLVDELFLTLAPQLVGRGDPGRLGLVEGVAFQPGDGRWAELVSVRRAGDHLFLRYRQREDHHVEA
jgi:riboflavin biosynthesis pyrimidine reductase